jgi:pilus assembly protein CpaF
MWQIRKPHDDAGPQPAADSAEGLVEVHPAADAEVDRHTELKVQLHHRLLDIINLSMLEDLTRGQIEGEVGDIIREELGNQRQVLNSAERKKLTSDVIDELLGLGPLEPLLKDPSITDILVNGPGNVFVERRGQLVRSGVRFKDDRHLLRIIQKIVSAVGRRVDEASPLVDARLADGSRVNAVVPPLAIDGALLSIRNSSSLAASRIRSRKCSRPSWAPAATWSFRAAPAPARRPSSMPCRPSSVRRRGSSRLRIRPSFSFNRST